MKVLHVSTVEPAEHFTRLTTTDVLANKSMTAKTVKIPKVGYMYFHLSVGFFRYSSNFKNCKTKTNQRKQIYSL